LRVFENRVQRGICGTNRNEVICYWRILHNKELHNGIQPNIFNIIKSGRTRRAVYVACMAEKENTIL
jgi:hypothetical protein